MTATPIVTVLMPVYNGTAHLAEAVEGVLAQTLRDFELIVVDDASTDDSAALVAAYADPRLRLVRNERNLGQAASLNRGLALARGPYVARVDQDDVSLPGRLERQRRLLDEASDVALVGTRFRAIAQAGRMTEPRGYRLADYGDFLGALLTGQSPVAHPTAMFRRDAVLAVGGYDATYAPADDVKLWIELARRRHEARVVPETLVLYREHPQQQSAARAALHREQWHRAHREFVADLCRAPADVLSLALRHDDALWRAGVSPHALVAAMRDLDRMLGTVRTTFALRPDEDAALRRHVARQVGRGVRLAARIPYCPAPLVRAVLFGLSPLRIPAVRRVLTPLARRARRRADVAGLALTRREVSR